MDFRAVKPTLYLWVRYSNIPTMQLRHQHIENFQHQHLTSSKWLCNVVQVPLKRSE